MIIIFSIIFWISFITIRLLVLSRSSYYNSTLMCIVSFGNLFGFAQLFIVPFLLIYFCCYITELSRQFRTRLTNDKSLISAMIEIYLSIQDAIKSIDEFLSPLVLIITSTLTIFVICCFVVGISMLQISFRFAIASFLYFIISLFIVYLCCTVVEKMQSEVQFILFIMQTFTLNMPTGESTLFANA